MTNRIVVVRCDSDEVFHINKLKEYLIYELVSTGLYHLRDTKKYEIVDEVLTAIDKVMWYQSIDGIVYAVEYLLNVSVKEPVKDFSELSAYGITERAIEKVKKEVKDVERIQNIYWIGYDRTNKHGLLIIEYEVRRE